MSGRSGDEARVEELLRVNAELAAQIRDVTSGRTPAPRTGTLGAARRLARLVEERDALAAELEAARSELTEREAHVGILEERQRELVRQIHEQATQIDRLGHEVARLRHGARGLLRRVRARLLRR